MTQTIVMYRGNDRTVQLTVKNSAGDAYNIAGCVVVMYIKKNVDDLDSEAIITKTGTLTAPANGVAEFYLEPADTNDATELEDNTPYTCDFELTTGSGEKYTVLRTTFVILTK